MAIFLKLINTNIWLRMFIKSLSLANFRSYKKISLDLSPKTNILLGNNASGKTNILEAIYTLGTTKSYRAKEKELILNDEKFFRVSALVENNIKEDKLLLIGSEEGKKAFKDDVEIKKISEFIGNLNVVLFSPDDMLLLKNGPGEKRKLLDYSLLQISKQYIEDYSVFKKQLKLRNDYLKYLYQKKVNLDDVCDEMLDVLTINYIDCNKKIFEARSKFLKNLQTIARRKYQELSGEKTEITFEYVINFNNDFEFYKSKYKQDIILGSTQSGCHRDDINFLKNGVDFETSSSEGEKRTLSLSIKLALADIIYSLKKESPVILLDDVFSELDKNHQNRLLKCLNKTMQIIITTTDIYKIGKEALIGAKIYSINNNSLKEIKING